MSPRFLQLGLCAVLGLVAVNRLTAETPANPKTDQLAFQVPKAVKPKVVEVEDPKEKTPSAIKFSKGKAQTEAEIRKLFDRPVEVNFVDTPLKDFVGFLGKSTGVNLNLDRAALAEEGVAIDEPINFKSKPIGTARVLSRVLPPLGLTWVIRNNAVQITTIIAADEMLTTRTYPVGDLLEYAKKEEAKAKVSAFRPKQRLHLVQFDGGIGPGIGGLPGSGCLPPENFGAGSWLIDTLQQNTEGPWVDIDGTGGSLSLTQNTLVIRQTKDNHEIIAGILDTIRRFTKGELKPSAVAIHSPHYSHDDDELVNKALEKVIDVKCKELPLNKFLPDLAGKLGVQFEIAEMSLAEEGVALDEPITLDVKNMPARSVLNNVLETLGLCFLIEDGWLYVTTIIAAEERLYTRIHDARDLDQAGKSGSELVDLLQQETSGPWIDIDGTGGAAQSPLPGLLILRQTHKVQDEVAQVLSDLRKEIAKAPKEEVKPEDPNAMVLKFYSVVAFNDPSAVSKAVQMFVEPDSWKQDGKHGVMMIVDQQLLIKHRPAVHKKVQDFLDNLNQAKFPYQGGCFGGGFFGGGGFGGGGGGGTFREQPKPKAGGAGFFQGPRQQK